MKIEEIRKYWPISKRLARIKELDEILQKFESKKLYNLIKQVRYFPVSSIQLIEEGKYLRKQWNKDLNSAKEIYQYYQNFGILDQDDISLHWQHYKKLQFSKHQEYKQMAKNPRQDNKDFINYGNHDGRAGRIRYPRKCRKTAWKRFYKLFPKLREEIS